jgi:hypothetical protein
MSVENELKHPADMPHFIRDERCLSVDVRVPPCFEQPIALPKGHVECFRQDEERVSARLRLSGFNKADMPRGKACAHCKVELAQSASRSPLPQEPAEWGRSARRV